MYHAYLDKMASMPLLGYSPLSTSRRSRWPLILLFLFISFQLALVSLSALSIYYLREMRKGNLYQIPTYTEREVLDAGWKRVPPPALQPPIPTEMTSTTDDSHLLILTTFSSSSSNLPTFFNHLDSFSHPRRNTSLGFLLSDEEDETEGLLDEYLEGRREAYRSVRVERRDFGIRLPKGEGRHRAEVQRVRRSILARARTSLLISSLHPSTSWVLWLDSDVQNVSSSLFQDLHAFGVEGSRRDADGREGDVVVANVFKERKGGVQGYDQNNWAETPSSIALRARLDPSTLVVEGNGPIQLHRLHLTSTYVAPNITYPPLTTHSVFTSVEERQGTNLWDEMSEAYVGKRTGLMGVGGVATLVRAEVHRMGAIFPSWLEENELETEGFGVLANKVGAKVVGLGNYLVWHRK